ncbi:hypothetical protein BS47DRAFT_1084477 [Hydnum rufescens UP504]|uniref:Zn(2)-C6 fungal-type domain-containing protein n=1 Tax=Hydnum rufescens UP504 TaxID=1448309 RepID=A0A9P6E265_9AGAM|nr:hypothetical protein BS47DRAFT_1084477 [Hydnum rufescens UP504]
MGCRFLVQSTPKRALGLRSCPECRLILVLAGTLASDVGSQRPSPSSPAPNIPNMEPAQEAGNGRRRVYLACRQCHSRKIKCDGAHPVCSTCIRRRRQCEYDDEPRRRGPDRYRRVRTHHDSGPPSSIRPRPSQNRAPIDLGASPVTTESPPYSTPDTSALISRIGLPNRPLAPPRGPFGSISLYPSPGTPRRFHQGSMNETRTHDPFTGSPSLRPSTPTFTILGLVHLRGMIPSYFLLFLVRAGPTPAPS